jgi:hypothetical protein
MTTSPTFETYLFRYRYDGKEWGFEIKATSLDDAKARLSQMCFARYDGVLKYSIEMPERQRWVKRLASYMSRAS